MAGQAHLLNSLVCFLEASTVHLHDSLRRESLTAQQQLGELQAHRHQLQEGHAA